MNPTEKSSFYFKALGISVVNSSIYQHQMKFFNRCKVRFIKELIYFLANPQGWFSVRKKRSKQTLSSDAELSP
jgi:hypothetical protein